MNRQGMFFLGALAAAAVAAAAGGSATSGAAGQRCSASGLSATPRAQPALPAAVARMRARVVRAAVSCDYRALERLARERGRTFEFSYSAARSPAAYWSRLERTRSEDVMAKLVKVLGLPHARNERGSYIWPSAHRARPTAADWRALRAIYPQRLIEQMRRSRSGYIGHRVAIAPSGDWEYYIAGD